MSENKEQTLKFFGVIIIILIIQMLTYSIFEHMNLMRIIVYMSIDTFTYLDNWLIIIIVIFGLPDIFICGIIYKLLIKGEKPCLE